MSIEFSWGTINYVGHLLTFMIITAPDVLYHSYQNLFKILFLVLIF